jgi:hypothetical protein
MNTGSIDDILGFEIHACLSDLDCLAVGFSQPKNELTPLFAIHRPQIAVSPLFAYTLQNVAGGGGVYFVL